MAAPIQNYVWGQGEDLTIDIVYKKGPLEAPTPVDLTNYSLRMDIVENGVRLFTFNSDDIVPSDPAVDETGAADNEAVLNYQGELDAIHIVIPRHITLPGGELFTSLATNNVFDYDIFLRDNVNDVQSKILRGQVTVEPRYTLWT